MTILWDDGAVCETDIWELLVPDVEAIDRALELLGFRVPSSNTI